MSKIVVTEFVSLDGVIEEPPGGPSPSTGRPRATSSSTTSCSTPRRSCSDSVTYEGFAAAWPSMGHDEFGQRMNTIETLVLLNLSADADTAQ